MRYLWILLGVLLVLAGSACDKSDDDGGGGSGGGGGPGPTPLSIVTMTLPVATQGTAFSTTLQATGGTPPYQWGLLSGTLPTGTSIGLTTGTLSGTPTSSGVFSFTVQCQDSASPLVQAIRAFNWTVNPSGGGGPTGTFGNLTQHPAHLWPYGLAAADFNGDTLPDLAVANFQVNVSPGNGAFSILTNTGGNFSAPLVYQQPSSISVREIATGDLNGDSKPDVVVASYGNNYIQVYLNNGAGGLTAQSTVSVIGPSSVSIGDMTADGIPDVIVGSDWSSSLSRVLVAVNNGAGVLTPAPAVTLTGMAGPVFAKACFLNGPFFPGVVVMGQSSSTLYAMEQTTGNPTWLTTPVANSLGAGGNPTDMAVADFDSDGKIDVAVVNGLSSSTVTLMRGLGTANFSSIGTLTAGNSSRGIVAADFDADGKPDLAVTNAGSNTVTVFLNSSGWVFQTGVSYGAGNTPSKIVCADFDGDSFLDLAFINDPGAMTAGMVSVLYGQ